MGNEAPGISLIQDKRCERDCGPLEIASRMSTVTRLG